MKEAPALNTLSQKELITQMIDKALPVAKGNIKESEFNYKDTAEDIEYVKRMKKIFQEEALRESHDNPDAYFIRVLAKVFEALVIDQIAQNEWFGKGVEVKKASDFDDIVNKVDAIVGIENGPMNASHLALAVDITTQTTSQKKFDQIVSEIKRGQLTEVKYFVSDILHFKGTMQNIPRVVVGADKKTIMDAVDKWINNTDQANQEALREHILQAIILEEIRVQLEKFSDFADSVGQSKVSAIYKKTLSLVNEIIAKKGFTTVDMADVSLDSVFSSIQFKIDHLK
jgi:hypothetical protein